MSLMVRTVRGSLAVLLLLVLGACGTSQKLPAPRASGSAPAKTGGYYLDDGPGENPLANLESIPDAVPRDEPLHRGANRPYTVFGKTYVPNVSNEPFRQQGLASWYGRKFHGNPTSIGEPYDMYGMTAAHPTLPLPSYVRVTHLANMRSVVVRVNDRGPFHSDRIIDLSFTAAAKLDLARKGSGTVVIERLFPGMPVPPMPTPAAATLQPMPVPTNISVSPITPEPMGFYLQLGAFSARDNAENFRIRMTRELDWNKEPIQLVHVEPWYRVRMGPYATRAEAEAIAAEVKRSHDFSPAILKQ